MKPVYAMLAIAAVLAGCGADGAPERPAPKSGVSVSGTVKVGVVGS